MSVRVKWRGYVAVPGVSSGGLSSGTVIEVVSIGIVGEETGMSSKLRFWSKAVFVFAKKMLERGMILMQLGWHTI